MVLHKLDLGSITKMFIEHTTHKLADQVPVLVFQFLEQKYLDINRMVHEYLQENRWEALQSPPTVSLMTVINQGKAQVFSVLMVVKPSLPLHQTGEKRPNAFQKRVDLPIDKKPGYT